MEDDAKAIVAQILSVVAFCHLQGIVHRDLKPEVKSWTSINIIIFISDIISFQFSTHYYVESTLLKFLLWTINRIFSSPVKMKVLL